MGKLLRAGPSGPAWLGYKGNFRERTVIWKMKQLSAEEQKKALAEYLWLSYFNKELRDKGMITQKEYQALQTQFLTRKPLPKMKSQFYEMEL